MELKEQIELLWQSLPARYIETERLNGVYRDLAGKARQENPSLIGKFKDHYPQEVREAGTAWYKHTTDDGIIMEEIYRLLDDRVFELSNGKFLVPMTWNEFDGEQVVEMERWNEPSNP